MKITGLILIITFTMFINCYAEDSFSYDDYKFLEEKEWSTSYGLNGDGEVKFFRVDKYENILQKKWWNNSFFIQSVTEIDTLHELGTFYNFSIEYKDSNSIMLQRSIEGRSTAVKRINDREVLRDDIVGRWSFTNNDKFRFEYRELQWDDYVYIIYIGGPQTSDSTLSDNTRGWFLLKYEGNGIFRSDGAYEDDKYRLEVKNSILRFIPEYNYKNKNIDTYVIKSKDFKR